MNDRDDKTQTAGTRLDGAPSPPGGQQPKRKRPSTWALPAASASTDPLVGRLVAGRFQVEELVAEGGAGRVYRAHQQNLARDVAIKFLHAHLIHSDEQRQRFHQEARAASQLAHPASVVIHDYGEWEGRYYIAMEFIEGRSLATVIREEFPFAPERIVDLLSPVCEVLQEAHEAGILHRDIKPDNLMVQQGPDGDERLRLVDFGLAKAMQEERQVEAHITPAGYVTGTPAFMSPEQCRARDLDARSDIYSLGIALYAMLCARPPFAGTTLMDLAVQHLYSEPPPPSSVRPELRISPGLESLALDALAKRPTDRPQTALAFRDRLQAAVRPGPRPSRAPGAVLPPELPADRAARAAAAGIPETPMPTRPAEAPVESTARVIVLEQKDDFATSLTAVLRAARVSVHPRSSLDALEESLEKLQAAVLVIDVRDDVEGCFERLAARIEDGAIGGVPLVVVGPEDSVAPMTRAIELGIRDYVPESQIARRLVKAVNRARRRR